MVNRLVSGIVGLILVGIGKIFNYFQFLGKTGDLIGIAGVIAILYTLWPIISFIFNLFFGTTDSSNYSSNNWEEKVKKEHEEYILKKEEEEKKRKEELEDYRRREAERKYWTKNNRW